MKSKAFFLLVAAAAVCAAGIFFASDQPAQRVNATAASVEPKQDILFPSPEKTLYRMSLYLDVNTRTLYGTTLLTTANTSGRVLSDLRFTIYADAFARPDTSPAPSAAYYAGFDPAGIEFEEIRVNHREVDYLKEGVTLHLDLPEDILPGEDITVEMKWKENIPRLAYRYGYQQGAFMLGNFYPALNVYDEQGWRTSYNSVFGDPFCFHCADYIVRLNIPEAYSMVSTGRVVERLAEDNGRQLITAVADKVRDFGLVVYCQYQESARSFNGTRISVHTPVKEQMDCRHLLEEAGAILNFFSCTWGSYPYPELKIAFVPMKGFHGMEYSGLVFLSEDLLNDGEAFERGRFILAHELAHQWWYGLVGNDQIREPWLDEGLANWGAYKYLAQQGQSLPRQRPPQPNTNLARELSQMYSRQDYYLTAYTGGESFWFGLEQELGEEKVKQVLRRYLANYRFRMATTADLLQVIRQEAHCDMEDYFNQWFNDKTP